MAPQATRVDRAESTRHRSRQSGDGGEVSAPTRENALEPDEDERVRVVVQQLVQEAGSQSAAARRIGMSQQTISRHLSGVPAGKNLAAKVAKAAGLGYRQLVRGDEVERSGAPRFGNLNGWPEAEAAARRRYRHIPPEAWEAVREWSGASAPERVTAEVVLSLATAWVASRQGDDGIDPD